MIEFYLKIFWLPTIASAVMLLIARNSGFLTNMRTLVIWFALTLVFQIVGDTFSPLWAIGLVLQVVLAVYMAIKIKAWLGGEWNGQLTNACGRRTTPVTPLAAKPPQRSLMDSGRCETPAYADTGQGRARRPAADAQR